MATEADEKIQLFRSLFRGRDDVFAKRWEKGDRSGYGPEYSFDWTEFNAHRARGGTLKDFNQKAPVPLSDDIIRKHLAGQMVVGIYPILETNESYLLVADFDKANWLEDCRQYQNELSVLGITGYIERSRSGNGGHVWVFFAEAFPCAQSRIIGLEAVRRALKLSAFDKEASFDRLFPNQDTISKDGFGNLVALPFQGMAVRENNTMFIEPESGEPYEDQHSLLLSVKRHTPLELETAYRKACASEYLAGTKLVSRKLHVQLGRHITLEKRQLNAATIAFLKDQLNFLNTEYLTKKRLGVSVYQTQKYFRLIGEDDSTVTLPRGFLGRLLGFLREHSIEYIVQPEMPHYADRKLKSTIKLSEVQEHIVRDAMVEKQGVIVAPPGSGKTMMGLELVARHHKPTLVLVHRQQLLDQWVERTQAHLGIPKPHIGRYSGARKTIGKDITVGLLQSLARLKDYSQIRNQFGTVIIDECHHVPAKTFRQVISELNPEFLYGLTATPKRKHNDEELIYVYIGDIIANMDEYIQRSKSGGAPFAVTIHETSLELPYNWKTDHFDLIAKTLCFDTARNKLIVEDVLNQVELGRKVLVLSERKEHLKLFELYCRGKCEFITLTGDDSGTVRASKQKQIEDGHYQIIFATGQLIGEGIHISDIETLILAFPFAFEGKLTQYLGRLLHSTQPKELIDYCDAKIPFLARQFKKRAKYYEKLR